VSEERPAAGLLRIAGGRLLTPDGWVEWDLEVVGGRVVAIRQTDAPRLADERVIDVSGLLVVPGFVDLQVNGAFGYDVTSDPESMWEIGARLPRTGVTAFLPTLISAPQRAVHEALSVLAAGPPDGYRGAVPLGLHLEGPMLAEARRGAHQESHLRVPSIELVEGWSRAAGVAMVTLAPELPRALDVVDELRWRGVVVAAGHSDATYDQALAAFERGITVGTHLFNAMSRPSGQEPGLVGALLAEEGVVSGLIADGVHVHPGIVRSSWRALGARGMALVTDATAAAGMPPGAFRLGDSEVWLVEGSVRDGRGVLSGSALTLDTAVRNLVAFTGCDPAEALTAASLTPARVLGARDRGSIEPGARADLVLLDSGMEVVATLVGGRVAFDAGVRAEARRG
jgi:N-acetylglucosamine-6-phosphate deacetylase